MVKFVSIILFFSTLCFAQIDSTNSNKKWDSTLPFFAEWALEQGVDLPKPFGVTAFFTFMQRDIEITNVDVTIANNAPQSINHVADFAIRNKTFVSAVRFDAWLLPLLNVYGLAGYTTTNSNLKAQFVIDRIILPLPPIEINYEENSIVGGPYFGAGATLVAGYKKWFIMADGNYGFTSLDAFDGKIDFWFLSARTGLSGSVGQNSWKAWVGLAYLYSKRTLHFTVFNELIGEIKVDVEQSPVNPYSIAIGGMYSISKKIEFMIEVGSNFEDAFIGVFTTSYRF